jgi:hypothetical protein
MAHISVRKPTLSSPIIIKLVPATRLPIRFYYTSDTPTGSWQCRNHISDMYLSSHSADLSDSLIIVAFYAEDPPDEDFRAHNDEYHDNEPKISTSK